MAVIAVLVAVAIPTFGNQLEKSRQAVDESNLREAYAAAKLAVLNQGDNGTTLYDATKPVDNESKVTDGQIYFWYDVDKEALIQEPVADGVAKKPSGKASLGKATSGEVVISKDTLPAVITYTNTQLASQDDADVVGTVKKAIVVTFSYKVNTGLYSLENIRFDYKAAELPVLTLATNTVTIVGTVSTTTLKTGTGKTTEGVTLPYDLPTATYAGDDATVTWEVKSGNADLAAAGLTLDASAKEIKLSGENFASEAKTEKTVTLTATDIYGHSADFTLKVSVEAAEP